MFGVMGKTAMPFAGRLKKIERVIRESKELDAR